MIKINNIIVQNEKFPNNELKINYKQISEALENNNNKKELSFYYRDDSDLMELYFILSYIEQQDNINEWILLIKYLPYSRMDRIKDSKEAFTLKYITNLINNFKLKEIRVFDCHSDVGVALLNNAINVNDFHKYIVERLISEGKFNPEKDYIFYPDAGATKRYDLKYKYLIANKNRDWETGVITNLSIIGDVPKEDFNVIIVDDLCSFGGTFLFSAKELKKYNCQNIYLVVCHCENNILKGKLFTENLITKVYTTNSIFTLQHEKIDVTEV